jgi:Fic family protein
MGHYIFEHIHPFYDGNGRTGRYLLARWLSEPLSILTSLSLSRAIFDNKDSYYRAFKSAQHPLMHGELTFFVMTMLGFVREAQDGLASRLLANREKLGEVDEALRQLQGRLELASQEVSILNMLSQVTLFATLPETRLADIAAYLGCGTATARKYTKALEKRGLLETVSRSPLVFVLSEHARSLLGLGDKITEA